MAEHNDLGRWGEDEAALFLEDEGYTILDRNWRLEHRDLDIVALSPQGKMLVVVEVKTRSSNDYQEPEQAVDKRKMRNLAIAANAYIKAKGIDKEVRFDIISIVGQIRQVAHVKHLKDAFNPMLVL